MPCEHGVYFCVKDALELDLWWILDAMDHSELITFTVTQIKIL